MTIDGEEILITVENRRGYFSLEAIDGTGKSKTTYFVPAKLIEDIQNNAGRKAQYYALLSAAQVLLKPTHIYQGLNRRHYENALCYIGCPERHGENWSGPAPPGMIFLVCVTENGVVFEWGWEKADESDNELPENATTRFRNRKWKNSSST